MTGTVGASQVRLHRDALNTPWGLRLQGGKDFKTPLSVQRVFVGSPADGELHRGDVILAIENYDATQLTHKQAQDIIKAAGSVISLRIRGGGSASSRPAAPVRPQAPKPVPQSYGTDYSSPHRGGGFPRPAPRPTEQPGMIGKLNQSLNQVIWQPGAADDQYGAEDGVQLHQVELNRQQQAALGDDEPYVRASVTDIKKHFLKPPKKQPSRRQAPPPPQIDTGADGDEPTDDGESSKGAFYNTNRGWQRPDPAKTGSLPRGLTEPGWSPVRGPGTPNTGAFNPVNRPPPINRPPPVNRPVDQGGYQPHPQQPRHLASEGPAWHGTLRSSGGSKPWEFRDAEAIAPGSAGPTPQQQPQAVRAQSLPGPSPAAVQPHQPKVQNMHYGADGGQRYEQHDPSSADSHQNAKVAHAQYNSPMGLYSKQSVEEAMHGQLSGKPGEGTIGVTSTGPGKNFDPRRSEVLRFLAEEGQTQNPPMSPHAPQQQEQYQSPAMQALEQRFGGEEALGTSDF